MNKQWDAAGRNRRIEHVTNGFGSQIAGETDPNIIGSAALDLDCERTPQQFFEHNFLFRFQIRKRLVTVFIGSALGDDTAECPLSMLGKVARHELIGGETPSRMIARTLSG